MPRFFFHIHDDGEVILDDEGGEFATIEEAKLEALGILADLLREAARGYSITADKIVVVDESGNEVAAFVIPKFP